MKTDDTPLNNDRVAIDLAELRIHESDPARAERTRRRYQAALTRAFPANALDRPNTSWPRKLEPLLVGAMSALYITVVVGYTVMTLWFPID